MRVIRGRGGVQLLKKRPETSVQVEASEYWSHPLYALCRLQLRYLLCLYHLVSVHVLTSL